MVVTWSDDMARRYDFLLPATSEFSQAALNQLLKQLDVATADIPISDLKVLDIACGTGAFAHVAADTLPKSTILGTDYSQDMINIFKAKTESLGLSSRVSGEVLDGQNLNTIADDSFDLVGCSFGIMFYPDQAKGWKEIHRVLKPGGFGAVINWVEADFIQILRKVNEELKPGFLHPMFVVAYSCADSDATIAKIKTVAPFSHVEAVFAETEFKPTHAQFVGFAKGALAMTLGPEALAAIGNSKVMAAINRALDAHGFVDGESSLNFKAVTYIVGK